MDGLKFDTGKPRLDLVPAEIIEAIGAVRTYGVQKYGKEYSYREVEPKRYRAALMRHICSWLKNPFGLDEESGLPHLWHVACNVAFLLELDKPTDKAEIEHFREVTKKIKSEAYEEFADTAKAEIVYGTIRRYKVGMKKSEAYWLLTELLDEADSKYSEALLLAMDLLQSEDLLTEALNDGRLQDRKEDEGK